MAAKKKQAGGADGIAGATKGVTKKLKALPATTRAMVPDSVLMIVGLVTLASSLLGAFVLYRTSGRQLLR